MSTAPVVSESQRVVREFNQKNGENMERLSVKREERVEAVHAAGVVPWSIWNFGPTEAIIYVLGDKISVPAATDDLGIKRTVYYGDTERTASVVVLRKEKGTPRPLSADNEPGANPNAPRVLYDWDVILPIAQARIFEFNYNEAENGPGGLLVIEGDSHVIGRNSDQIVRVPTAKRSKSGTMIYSTHEVSLAQKLDAVLTRQKNYCFSRLNLAREWFDQGEIASVHDGPKGFAAWGQFAVKMGWKHQTELDWMVAQSALESCKKCGTGRKSGAAMFCTCGAPYDAYAAFMAGFPVDVGYLTSLPEDKQAEVRHEMRRRENFFKDAPEAEKPKRGKKDEAE